MLNVQQRMAAWHTDAMTGDPHALVLNDNGTGEIADLIVIHLPAGWLDANGDVVTPLSNLPAGSVRVTLCHCKWAGSDAPRRDLDDLDQVVGQAHRSVRWLANPSAFWETLSQRLFARTRVVAGNPTEVKTLLDHLATSTPGAEFNIQIAQPGLDINQVAGWAAGETLLSFLIDAAGTVGAELTVVGA